MIGYSSGWTNHVRNLITQWQEGTDGDARKAARNNLQAELRTRFSSERFFSARDAEAQAIAALAKEDKNVAAVAMAMLHGLVSFDNRGFLQYGKNLEGIARGLAIAAGIDAHGAKGAVADLNRVRQDFENDANRLRATIDAVKSTAVAAAAAVDSEARAQRDRLQVEFKMTEDTRQQAFNNMQSNLDAVRLAYETRMQLRGPVRYWESKAKRHVHAKWTAAGILVVYIVLATLSLLWIFDHAAAFLPTTTSDPVPYSALFKAGAFALLASSIAFWIGRVLLRIYLSNQHLATDAQERMTMVMTFLALVRSKSIKDEERQLILTPLFRSASDGIVKDETSPDTALAALLSNLAKGGKP